MCIRDSIGATVVFHVVGRSISSLEALEEGGWLIGPFDNATGFRPVGPSDLQNADWGVIVGHALPIVAVIGVAVVGLLLNLGGLESVLDTEIEMDREVSISGLANAIAAAAGGNPGWALMGSTTLAHQLGARGRSASLIIAGMAIALVAIGPDVIGLMPRTVAGGVLGGLGINLLVGWARDSLPRHSRVDRALSVGILAAIAVLGILPGVAIGVITAALLFAGRSSRVEPARHIVAAAGHSNVDRSRVQREALEAQPSAIVAVELHGFLFFGSALKLRDLVVEQVLGDNDDLRFVIMDFQRVTGTDSTAAAALGSLAERLNDRGVTVLWSATGPEVGAELERNGVELIVAELTRRNPNVFIDLDHAVAHAEDRWLEESEIGGTQTASFNFSPALLSILQAVRVDAGEVMASAGDPGTNLFFVQRGRFGVWTTTTAGKQRRLRQVMPGAVIGEIAFLTRGDRTADVIADTDADILVLDRQAFDDAAETNPNVVIELQRVLLAHMADRVVSSGEIIRELRN